MRIDGQWTDMATRGFVVVRELISKKVVDELVDGFQNAPSASAPSDAKGNTGSMMKAGSPGISAALQGPIREALAPVAKETDIRLTDFDPYTWYFSTKGTQGLSWHTDPPLYYTFQNYYQYANIWVPIVKPNKDQSGMGVVPMDALAKRAPKVFEKTKGRGGALLLPTGVAQQGEEAILRFFDPSLPREQKPDPGPDPKKKSILFEDNGHLGTLPLDFDLDEIAVFPDVGPGDAIIARGDVLHRTQDQLTDRTAISIHAVNGEMLVTKDFLRGLSLLARRRLSTPKQPFASKCLGAFAFYGKDRISVRDLLAFFADVDARKPDSMRILEAVEPKVPEMLGVA